MLISHVVEALFNVAKQDLTVIDVNTEFSLKGVMNEYAGPEVCRSVLSIPVSFEGDRHSVPSVWIDVSESVSYSLDHSFGDQMWLLVQMVMVVSRVVEESHG
mmetsp:Transcript_54305/g.100330  ORF Transcript_54305/g.100330 Transcript_54305/m.100330 type:complete len:102 (+) Transcript_54305:28-333(+)